MGWIAGPDTPPVILAIIGFPVSADPHAYEWVGSCSRHRCHIGSRPGHNSDIRNIGGELDDHRLAC